VRNPAPYADPDRYHIHDLDEVISRARAAKAQWFADHEAALIRCIGASL